MNIKGYVKKYQNVSFRDRRFTDVDSLIFAELSYINFHLILKEGQTSIRLGDISDEDLARKEVYEGSVDAKNNYKLLVAMAKSIRYRDLVIKDIVNKFSKEDEVQFYAFTILFPNNTLYITYRGTDTTLTGWKEDFMMSVYDKIRAQIYAEKYMLKTLKEYPDSRFYLGGHSKGGNLAFYAALYIEDKDLNRFIGAFSFDGPGFKDGIAGFKSYEKVKGRLIKYLTFNNIIGSVFSDVEKHLVVYSHGILGGHDPFGWMIKKDSGLFFLAADVSNSSKNLNGKFMGWFDELEMSERMLTIEAFFRVFGNNETIYDLFKNLFKNVFGIKKALSVYSKDDQQSLKSIFKRLIGFMLNEKHMRRVKKKERKNNELENIETTIDE